MKSNDQEEGVVEGAAQAVEQGVESVGEMVAAPFNAVATGINALNENANSHTEDIVCNIKSHVNDRTPLSPFPTPESSPVSAQPLVTGFEELRKQGGSRG